MTKGNGIRTLWLLAALAAAPQALAELYRCEGSDGVVVFTDQEGSCPGALAHEPSGSIQTLSPAIGASAPAKVERGRTKRSAVGRAQKGVWREKKLKAEESLEALTAKRNDLDRFITHCNRNRKILQEGASGLLSKVSCKNIREEYEEVKARQADARAYLSGTLEEECRRAGCLPGWIR